MKLKKTISVILAVLILSTAFSFAVFADGDRANIYGPEKRPSVDDTVESFLLKYGSEDLTGCLTVTIVRMVEGYKGSSDDAIKSAVDYEASDENIDFYGQISAVYADGVRDESSITYAEFNKENGAWTETSGSTFTEGRKYKVACFVETANGILSDNIYGQFGNGALYVRITNTCVEGTAYLVPTKFVEPVSNSSSNFAQRIIQALEAFFAKIKAFFEKLFG